MAQTRLDPIRSAGGKGGRAHAWVRLAAFLALLLPTPWAGAASAELSGPAASAPVRTEAKLDEERLRAFEALLPVPPAGWSASPVNLSSSNKESKVSRYYAKAGSTTFEIAILFSNATVDDYGALLSDTGKAAARGFGITTIKDYPALAAVEQKTYQPDYAVIVSNSRIVAAYPGGGKPDRVEMLALFETIDLKAVADQ
jgi:hypothetical protein